MNNQNITHLSQENNRHSLDRDLSINTKSNFKSTKLEKKEEVPLGSLDYWLNSQRDKKEEKSDSENTAKDKSIREEIVMSPPEVSMIDTVDKAIQIQKQAKKEKPISKRVEEQINLLKIKEMIKVKKSLNPNEQTHNTYDDLNGNYEEKVGEVPINNVKRKNEMNMLYDIFEDVKKDSPKLVSKETSKNKNLNIGLAKEVKKQDVKRKVVGNQKEKGQISKYSNKPDFEVSYKAFLDMPHHRALTEKISYTYFTMYASKIFEIYQFFKENGGFYDILANNKLEQYILVSEYYKSKYEVRDIAIKFLYHFLEYEQSQNKNNYRESFHYNYLDSNRSNNSKDLNWLNADPKLIRETKQVSISSFIERTSMNKNSNIEEDTEVNMKYQIEKVFLTIIDKELTKENPLFIKNLLKEFGVKPYLESITEDYFLERIVNSNEEEEGFEADIEVTELSKFNSPSSSIANFKVSMKNFFSSLLDYEKMDSKTNVKPFIGSFFSDYSTFKEKILCEMDDYDNTKIDHPEDFYHNLQLFFSKKNKIIQNILSEKGLSTQDSTTEFEKEISSRVEIRTSGSWFNSLNESSMAYFSKIYINQGPGEVLFITTANPKQAMDLKQILKNFYHSQYKDKKEKDSEIKNNYIPSMFYLMNGIEINMTSLQPGDCLVIPSGITYSNIVTSNKNTVLLSFKSFANNYETAKRVLAQNNESSSSKGARNTMKKSAFTLPMHYLMLHNLNLYLNKIDYNYTDFCYTELKEKMTKERIVYDKVLQYINNREKGYYFIKIMPQYQGEMLQMFCMKCCLEIANFFAFCKKCCSEESSEKRKDKSLKKKHDQSFSGSLMMVDEDLEEKDLDDFENVFCLNCFVEHIEIQNTPASSMKKGNESCIIKDCILSSNTLSINFKYPEEELKILFQRCERKLNHIEDSTENQTAQAAFLSSKAICNLDSEIVLISPSSTDDQINLTLNNNQAPCDLESSFVQNTENIHLDIQPNEKTLKDSSKVNEFTTLLGKKSKEKSMLFSIPASYKVYNIVCALYEYNPKLIDYNLSLRSINNQIEGGLEFCKLGDIQENPKFSPAHQAYNSNHFMNTNLMNGIAENNIEMIKKAATPANTNQQINYSRDIPNEYSFEGLLSPKKNSEIEKQKSTEGLFEDSNNKQSPLKTAASLKSKEKSYISTHTRSSPLNEPTLHLESSYQNKKFNKVKSNKKDSLIEESQSIFKRNKNKDVSEKLSSICSVKSYNSKALGNAPGSRETHSMQTLKDTVNSKLGRSSISNKYSLELVEPELEPQTLVRQENNLSLKESSEINKIDNLSEIGEEIQRNHSLENQAKKEIEEVKQFLKDFADPFKSKKIQVSEYYTKIKNNLEVIKRNLDFVSSLKESKIKDLLIRITKNRVLSGIITSIFENFISEHDL